jgi:3-phenylpropionate/trans-cinnamate dioxygenase ferredoxin reductase subunit
VRPPKFDVLIAGGGLAAQRCCETLRRHGFSGSIGILCEEPRRPYDRPPLSKEALTGPDEPRPSTLRSERWYVQNDVELLLGMRACELDTCRAGVLVTRPGHSARTIRFERLVIASGSRPRRLDGIEPGRDVHELRTYEDALALRAGLRGRGGGMAIIGAGLIGMEVASSALAVGRDVTLLEAADTPLGRVLPPALGRWIDRFHREHGVHVRLSTTVRHLRPRPAGTELELSDGSRLDVTTVLLAAGTEPATAWLSSSGLGPGAVRTDHRGRTVVPRVFAAGDASSWMDRLLGRPVACQHWEAAARQGAAVARTIVGLPQERPRPPMFWSDQHAHRIQFVGRASQNCLVELPGPLGVDEPFVAWMYEHGRAQAALLLDSPEAVGEARRRIEREHSPEDGAMAA